MMRRNASITARLKAAARRWLDVRPEASRTKLLVVCPANHTLVEPGPEIVIDCSSEDMRLGFYCPICGCMYYRTFVGEDGPLLQRQARWQKAMTEHGKDAGGRVG